MMNNKNTWCMDKSGQDKEIDKNGTSKKNNKNNVERKTRRTYLRDKRAPKPPYSGYIRFLNDRRVQFSSQNPNLPFSEITKVLATEWNQMPAEKKQIYLSAAEQERVKYDEELEAYKKTDAYRNFQMFKSNRKKYDITIKKEQKLNKEKPSNTDKFKKDQEIKKENPSNDNKFKKVQELEKKKPSTTNSGDQEFMKEKPSTSSDNSNDIPIFTEEFLNFNKARDSELRNLRKKVTDQEQEVCVLDKHIENMQNVSIKLVANNEQLNVGCSKYEEYLVKLRSRLLDAFANTAFPDNTEQPTHENIDAYMVKYFTYQATGTDTDPSWITYFKKALSNFDPSQC
ncbi:high mobility group protein 20A-like isoform X2 [Metopolophium dirhodum]|uniref:high mobility group protein 20A-like isoform X2 n=1 Tax=Metopolophium dirhodum TaxID=44670 RepID=UPI0029905040|nr:high mobility group protein 20A-like isoform X2 [Metopolophium dirhodum]